MGLPGEWLPADGHGRVFEPTAALATTAVPLATADFYSRQPAALSAATAAVATAVVASSAWALASAGNAKIM